jgi:hypothetical protein
LAVNTTNPLDTQVGGNHYKSYAIQPIEYAMANRLNYCQANAIKYVTRYGDKGGKEDLLKAIHNIELLIELEYGERADDRRD